MKKWKTFEPVSVLVQLTLWGMVLSLPLLMSLVDGKSWSDTWQMLLTFLPNNLFLMLVFYLNYFWLIPRFLFKRRTLAFFLVNLVLLLAMRQLLNLLTHRQAMLDAQAIPASLQIAGAIGYAVLLMLLILSAIGLRTQQRNNQLELQVAEEEKQKVVHELERLKNQLNPHFLFNTLNNISSLAAFDPDQAQISISRLSEMLRYVLYDSTAEQVLLPKECSFMQNYIDLMRLRYTDTLRVEVDMKPADTEVQVAPLLFIALLENAFKHGADSRQPCYIRVMLRQEGEELLFRVSNSITRPIDKNIPGGVGQENLKQRLRLLYPDAHELYCGAQEGGGYVAELKLQWKKIAL